MASPLVSSARLPPLVSQSRARVRWANTKAAPVRPSGRAMTSIESEGMATAALRAMAERRVPFSVVSCSRPATYIGMSTDTRVAMTAAAVIATILRRKGCRDAHELNDQDRGSLRDGGHRVAHQGK